VARYEYRVVIVECILSGDGYLRLSTVHHTKRPDGSTTNCYLKIHDTGHDGTHLVTDEKGEKDFYPRALRLTADYLNALGAEGWRVVSLRGREDNSTNGSLNSFPAGTYLLMRER